MSDNKKRKFDTLENNIEACEYQNMLQKVFEKDILEYHALREHIDNTNRLFDSIEAILDIYNGQPLNKLIQINNENFYYYVIPKNVPIDELINYVSSKCKQVHKLFITWDEALWSPLKGNVNVNISSLTLKIDKITQEKLQSKILRQLKYELSHDYYNDILSSNDKTNRTYILDLFVFN